MNKKKSKPILATFCPSGHLNEPALIEKYKGCSIYSYYDCKKHKQLVMLDQDFYIKYGTNEALSCKHRTNLEMKYNLKFVRKI